MYNLYVNKLDVNVIVDVFGDGDFLKIWKGLHYCMWMTDKPLIQVFSYDSAHPLDINV